MADQITVAGDIFTSRDLFGVIDIDGERFVVASVRSSSRVTVAPMTWWEQRRYTLARLLGRLLRR